MLSRNSYRTRNVVQRQRAGVLLADKPLHLCKEGFRCGIRKEPAAGGQNEVAEERQSEPQIEADLDRLLRCSDG